MSQWNFAAYVKLLRAWISSNKDLTLEECGEYAIQTAAALAHIDLSTPWGALVLSIVEGLILSPHPHQENYGVPVSTPGEAVSVALKMAEEHSGVPVTWDTPVIERPEVHA